MNVLGPAVIGVGILVIIASSVDLIRGVNRGLAPRLGLAVAGGVFGLVLAVLASAIPYLAHAVAGAIVIVAIRRSQASELVRSYWLNFALAAAAWVLYGFYEIAARAWQDTVVAPIRVDLFLIYPLLAGSVAFAAALLTVRQLNKPPRLVA